MNKIVKNKRLNRQWIILPDNIRAEKFDSNNIFVSEKEIVDIVKYNLQHDYVHNMKKIKRRNNLANIIFALICGVIFLSLKSNFIMFGVCYILFDIMCCFRNELKLYIIPKLKDNYYSKNLNRRKRRIELLRDYRGTANDKTIEDFIKKENQEISETERLMNESEDEKKIRRIVEEIGECKNGLNVDICVIVDLIIEALSKILDNEVSYKNLKSVPNKMYIYIDEFIENLGKYVKFDEDNKVKYKKDICEVGMGLVNYIDDVRKKLCMKDEVALEVSLDVLRGQLMESGTINKEDVSNVQSEN